MNNNKNTNNDNFRHQIKAFTEKNIKKCVILFLVFHIKEY